MSLSKIKAFGISEEQGNIIEDYSLIMLVCILVVPLKPMAICTYIFAGLNLCRVIAGRNYVKEIRVIKGQNYLLLVNSFYFGVYLLSLTWTMDLDIGIGRMDTRLNFVWLPLIFAVLRIRVRKLTDLLWSYVLAVTGVLLSCFVTAFFYGIYYNDFITPFKYYNFGFWLGQHPGYLSMLTLISLAVILHLSNDDKKRRTILFIIAAFQIFSIVFIGARFAIGLLFVILCFGALDVIRQRVHVNWSKVLSVAVACLVILVLAVGLSKNARNRILDFKTDLGSRIEVYDVALDLIKERPWLGYGAGGDQKLLISEYEKRGLTDAAEQKYNVHNQYLQTLLETGVPGAVAFILLLYAVIKSSQVKVLSARILFLFLLFFLIESALRRLQAVMPFVTLSLIFASLVPDSRLNRKH